MLRQHTEFGYISEKNVAIQNAKVEGEKIGIEKGEKIGIEKGKLEGEKIGIEKGKAEGANEKAIEVAKKMLSMGLSIEQISEATGLSIDDLRKLP